MYFFSQPAADKRVRDMRTVRMHALSRTHTQTQLLLACVCSLAGARSLARLQQKHALATKSARTLQKFDVATNVNAAIGDFVFFVPRPDDDISTLVCHLGIRYADKSDLVCTQARIVGFPRARASWPVCCCATHAVIS